MVLFPWLGRWRPCLLLKARLRQLNSHRFSQESAPSGTLFLVGANDIISVLPRTLYVDDFSIFFSGQAGPLSSVACSGPCTSSLVLFFCSEDGSYVFCGQHPDLNLYLGGLRLSMVENYPFLGVFFDWRTCVALEILVPASSRLSELWCTASGVLIGPPSYTFIIPLFIQVGL